MADPKYVGESAALIKALLKHYEGKIGKPKDAYGGRLTAERSPAWSQKQKWMEARMKNGPPKQWAQAQAYSQKYLGGGGGGRIRPGGDPSGGLPTWDRNPNDGIRRK